MSKALTTFVLLNLLASAAILTLGALSYRDGQVLKAQTLELESTVQTVTENLQWGEEVAWESPEEKKPLAFSLPSTAEADDLDSLESALEEMVRFSRQRQAQLSLRYAELESARQNLAQVEETLATRTRELEAAQNQQAQVKRSLAEEQKNLREAEEKLVGNSPEKDKLEEEIEEKNTAITNLNNELASLEIDLETRIQERDLAQTEYDKCLESTASEVATAPGGEIKGKRATILAVNPDWQYVIIDKGMIDNVELGLNAFVHRGKEYVGKLQVVRVEDSISVAEILNDSIVSTDSIEPGDTIFF